MSKTKKIISVVLALALVMSMAAVAMVTASASTKVYFEDSYGWSTNANIYAYCYGGDGELFGAWPGAVCTDEGNGVWSIEMTGAPEAVIFNNNAGSQTSNIVFEGTGKIAKLTGNQVQGDYQMVDEAVWEDYAVADETTAAAPVETTAAAPVETTAAAPVETTAAAPVETTAAAPAETEATEATDATEATTATEDEQPTTAATEDEQPTDAVEPTTDAVEPTTDAVEPTTEAVEPTTAEVEPTTAEVEPTTAEVVDAAGVAVDGTIYEVAVGDIITYTANLTTPKNIENVQAYTTYDAAKLKLVDADAATRFPNMTGVVSNASEGVIYFNASEISTGFDFTSGQTLIYLQFEVLDASYSEITTIIEEMVEFFGGDYVTGSEVVADGVTLVENLDVPVVIETTTVADDDTTTAPTDATSATKDEEKPIDVVPTGVAATIYVVLAVLAMAAAAVVVLRKKVNG